ncbi:MAG: O-antigen ligase family protein [Clostridia bacterium]|nr:O-antigen ligase family protein [Clostridia bacterium]
METISAENKSSLWVKILKVRDKVESFCVKDYFPFIVALFAFVFHVFGLDIFGIITFILLSATTLFVFCDGKPGFVIGIIAVFMVSRKNFPGHGDKDGINYYVLPQTYIPIICAVVIFLAVAVVVCIRNRKVYNKASLFVPFLVASIAILISGIGQDYYLEGLPYATLFAFSFVGIYLFVLGFMAKTENLLGCLASLASALALLISFQVAFVYVEYLLQGLEFDGYWKNFIHLGWGISNNAGAMLTFCLPFIMNRVEKGQKFHNVYHVIAILSVVAIVATLCKAAMIVGIPMFIILWIRAVVKSPERKKLILTAIILVAVGLIGFIIVATKVDLSYIFKYFQDAIKSIGDSLFNSSRNKLLHQAIDFFVESPIVGAGFAKNFHYPIAIVHDSIFHTLTHNFIFQALGSGGIIGFGAMVYLVICLVRLFIKKYENKFCILSFVIAFTIISLLDITYFLTYCVALFVLVTVATEKAVADKEKENEEN